MMRHIQLKIAAADGQKLHSNWGYALYGILSSYADPDYIAYLHSYNETPISQYLQVLPNKTEAWWHINLLGADAIEKIGAVCEHNDSFEAEHHQTNIQVLDKEWGPIVTEKAFCQSHLTEQPPKRRLRLEFLTPTGFKSQEVYQLFPTEELIMKSVWRGWQNFANEVVLQDDDVRNQLIRHIHISDYHLRSVRYPIKGNKIPAFIGGVTLAIAGPEPLVRLANMLLAFGEYNGMGIKTALGMGGYCLV